MLELFITILISVMYYIPKALTDGFVNLEKDQCTGKKDIDVAKYANGAWHTVSTIRDLVFHGLLLAFFQPMDILLSVCLFWVSVGVRIVIHDPIIDRTRGRGWNFTPTKDGDWDWWDGILVFLKKKHINQYVFRISLFLIPVILYLIIL